MAAVAGLYVQKHVGSGLESLCVYCARQWHLLHLHGPHLSGTELRIALDSERPRSLLLSLGVPSRPSLGSDPGPIQVPSRVRRGPVQIRHVLCFTAFRTHPGPEVGAIPARPGPILVPTVLPGSGLDGPKQTSWPLPIDAHRIANDNRGCNRESVNGLTFS